jgi:hypothetical protein
MMISDGQLHYYTVVELGQWRIINHEANYPGVTKGYGYFIGLCSSVWLAPKGPELTCVFFKYFLSWYVVDLAPASIVNVFGYLYYITFF